MGPRAIRGRGGGGGGEPGDLEILIAAGEIVIREYSIFCSRRLDANTSKLTEESRNKLRADSVDTRT